MVRTAVVTALVIFATGALLMRLLHITSGAVAVAGGIILALLAIKMARCRRGSGWNWGGVVSGSFTAP
jgi:small neutral amino acid transporter SnatA (MarC family)